jgi:hypothetical protein
MNEERKEEGIVRKPGIGLHVLLDGFSHIGHISRNGQIHRCRNEVELCPLLGLEWTI